MGSRGMSLYASGHYTEALTASEKAAARYRSEAARDPERNELALAAELRNVGMCLSQLRRHRQAVTVFEDAAEIYCRRWQADPGLGPVYARVLASLAESLGKLGRYDEGVEITSQVVALRRFAINAGQQAADPELADALRLYAHMRVRAGLDLDNAEAAAAEAVAIYRHVTGTSRRRFLAEQHAAYLVFAAVLDSLGRHDEAAQVRAQRSGAREPRHPL